MAGFGAAVLACDGAARCADSQTHAPAPATATPRSATTSSGQREATGLDAAGPAGAGLTSFLRLMAFESIPRVAPGISRQPESSAPAVRQRMTMA